MKLTTGFVTWHWFANQVPVCRTFKRVRSFGTRRLCLFLVKQFDWIFPNSVTWVSRKRVRSSKKKTHYRGPHISVLSELFNHWSLENASSLLLFGLNAKAKTDSGCITVSRAVASDTRDAQFEFNHRQFLYSNNCFEKTTYNQRQLLILNIIAQKGFCDLPIGVVTNSIWESM